MKITVFNPIYQGENFTLVLNETLRDASLSWKATGMLAYILSHDSSQFTVSRQTLNKAKSDGESSTRSGIKELIDKGYLKPMPARDSLGKFVDRVYVLNGRKIENPQVENPCVENPQAENPCVENPQVEKNGHKNTNIKNTNIKEKENINICACVRVRDPEENLIEASKNHASIDAKKKAIPEKLESNSHSQARIELDSSPQPQKFPSLAQKNNLNDINSNNPKTSGYSAYSGVRVKNTRRANEGDNRTTDDRHNSSKRMEERFNRRSHYQPNKLEWEQYASGFMSDVEIEGFQEWFGRTRLAGKGCYRERQPDRLEIRRAISARFSSISNPDDETYIQECMAAYMREKAAIERRSEVAVNSHKQITEEDKAFALEARDKILAKFGG